MLCLVGRCLPIFNVAAFSVEISFAFLGKILLIFLLIYLLAELTPKIAKKIDTHIEKHKKSPEDERLYSVRSAFEPHDTDPSLPLAKNFFLNQAKKIRNLLDFF